MNASKLYISLALSLVLSACSNEFLDLKPISSATADNFYRTADDIKNAVNGAYASLQSGGVFGTVMSLAT